MFQQLTDRISDTCRRLRGEAEFTEKNTEQAIHEVHVALLEADVAQSVIQNLLNTIKQKVLGTAIQKNIKPHDAFIKIIYDSLVHILSDENTQQRIYLKKNQLTIILVSGLQGTGKTTSVAKLARWLQKEHKVKVIVASTDIYRKAAIEQLKAMAEQAQCLFHPSSPEEKPENIAHAAIKAAKETLCDVLIIDTAGRLHIDNQMMDEISALAKQTNPHEILYVLDSMVGQDAIHSAQVFHETLPLTGIILTKTDGDSRGGAALSVKHMTGKPIKFMGTGERVDQFDYFDPQRIASQILNMGDIVALVQDMQEKIDHQKAQKAMEKLKAGKTFDLQDYRDQLEQMQNMGGIEGILSKLPKMGMMDQIARQKFDDSQLKRTTALIDSMTPKERVFTALLKQNSRKKRIIRGAGAKPEEFNRLIKEFTKMQKMMQQFSGGKMKKMMQMMQMAKGKMPPGMDNIQDLLK